MRNASDLPERNITRATFEVRTELLTEFREIAKLHERTFSQQVRLLMVEYIEEFERQREAKAA